MSFFSKLVRHKTVEQLQAEVGTRGDFRRVLGLWQLTAIGIGGIERDFRAPGMPAIPPSGWLRFSIRLVIGLVIYGLYGYRRAHLNTARNN